MLIACKLHRPGGSKIVFGKGREAITYHFKPADSKADHADPRIDHVAEVTDKAHISRLLAIPEAYEVADGQPGVVAAAPKTDAGTSSKDRAALEAQLREEIEAKVRAEFEAKAKAAAKDAAPGGEAEDATNDAAIEKMTRKQLLAAVAKKAGKKPHPSTSDAKLREMLRAK